MLDRTKTLRELTPAYRQAVRAALPAGVSPTDEAKFWAALEQLVADYSGLVNQRKRRPPKAELKRWKRVAELLDELGDELRGVRDQPRWDEMLKPLKDASAVSVAGYAQLTESMMRGRGIAQNFLYGGILDLWRDLGQPLRYSKNASQPVGPLIRFFVACASPLLGEDMPTPRGVADVIDRNRKPRSR